jgi:hypothetical protein
MTRKPFLSLDSLKATSKDFTERPVAGAEAADNPKAALPSPAAIRHAAKKH